MKQPWYKTNPSLFAEIERQVQAEYLNLHFFAEGDIVFVRGSFPLSYQGRILDRYLIEIELPKRDPEDVPIVREIGGRIPHTMDNHINPGTPKGDICLFVPDERWKVFPKGSSMLDFLNGPVRNYFLGFSLVQLGEAWPFGERKHGGPGIVESYTELLGTSDVSTIKRYLQCLSAKVLKGHWLCPCGSGAKIRKCQHQSLLRELRAKILPTAARASLQQLNR